MEDNSLTLKLISLLVIVSLVAVLVAIYHFITVSWCNRRWRIPSRPPHRHNRHDDHELTDYSLENSVVLLIPAHKHQKVLRVDSKGRSEGDDEAMCSICLCEFEENEELRTLPECLHSFHVACIDMWLYSHSTCPVCRADAVPSTQILFQILDSDSHDDMQVVRPEEPSNHHLDGLPAVSTLASHTGGHGFESRGFQLRDGHVVALEMTTGNTI